MHQKDNLTFASILIMVSFVSISLVSNIASAKIGNVFGFAVDMGTFLYPLIFTIRDLVHKRLGKNVAQKLIIISSISVLFMSMYFYLIGLVPEDKSWDLNDAFISIVSPVFRIALASIISAAISELLDTEIYHIIYKKFKSKFQWLRVVASNGISIPIDSIIFTLIAFFGQLPTSAIFQIIIFNIVVKYIVTIFSVPMIYIFKDKSYNKN